MVDTRKKGKASQSKKAKIASKHKPPVKLTAPPAQPPSVNHCFLTGPARDRFKEIRSYRVIQERRCLLHKLVGNPEFEQVFIARGWHGLNDTVFKEANKTMTLEFYANARFSRRRYGSYVRGKDIDFSPQEIDDLLNLVPPEQCDVQRRRDTCEGWDDETWEEVKSLLCVEGAQLQGIRRMLLKSDLKPVAKAWASFVVQTLEGTLCSSEIPLVRTHTIAAIRDGGPINVGELIANNIVDFVAGNKKAIPHMSLINWLCEEADCELYVNDIETKMMKPMTDTYMVVFLKDYMERMQQLGAEEETSPQPQPQP